VHEAGAVRAQHRRKERLADEELRRRARSDRDLQKRRQQQLAAARRPHEPDRRAEQLRQVAEPPARALRLDDLHERPDFATGRFVFLGHLTRCISAD
jgi:hypothetical protein